MQKLFTFAFMISLLASCSNTDSKENRKALIESAIADKPLLNNFEMINEVKLETSGKAQFIEYAIYKDTVFTRSALKNVVMSIYNLNRGKKVFISHDVATVLGVYLFTSKDAYEDKSNWIAMLIKGPNAVEPEIIFNNFKITALNDLADKVKSSEEIELLKLEEYLKKRGLDLCGLSKLLKKIALDNIHMADAKYPDYGDEHNAMIEQLDKVSQRNLKHRYKLSDDILYKVPVFAMSYCK